MCLDPVYAGKAVALMLRQMREAPGLFRGRKVLFVQTGGLLGLFDKETQVCAERSLPVGAVGPPAESGGTCLLLLDYFLAFR